MKPFLKRTLLGAATLLSTCSLSADDILVPLPANDMRSTPDASGVVATEGWSDSGSGFKINWTITPIGSDFHYLYTITNASGGALSNDLYHLLLEVSPTVTPNNLCDLFLFNTVPSQGPATFSPGVDNPGMPGDIYGLKFETFLNDAQPTIEFVSIRPPIWGDFYAVDGKGATSKDSTDAVYAYNSGFGTDPTQATNNFTPWIPVPDTEVPIPEPTTMLLLGSTLCAAALIRRRTARR